MKVVLQIISTLVVIAIGVGLAMWIDANKPKPLEKPSVKNEVLVRVQPVAREEVRFRIPTQGTVRPRTDTSLVSEVAGRVLEISPDFEEGAFFEKGALLARIEDVDYQLEVVRARAEVASTTTALAQMEAEAKIAIAEWKREGRTAKVPSLVAREPQLEEARARLQAAKATLARSQRDLERTTIRAPYDGRVRTRTIDRGAYVTRGVAIGRLYAVDWVEVTLPLTPDETAFVTLPRAARAADSGAGRPRVRFTARIGGKDAHWEGELVRTRGEINPRTRMIEVIARIEDPYGRRRPASEAARPALAVGQFLRAEIEGKSIPDLMRVPRAAMRDGSIVLVVEDGKLRSKRVELLRRERDEVLVSSGLDDGAKVVVSPLEVWTDGMAVRVAADAADGAKPESDR